MLGSQSIGPSSRPAVSTFSSRFDLQKRPATFQRKPPMAHRLASQMRPQIASTDFDGDPKLGRRRGTTKAVHSPPSTVSFLQKKVMAKENKKTLNNLKGNKLGKRYKNLTELLQTVQRRPSSGEFQKLTTQPQKRPLDGVDSQSDPRENSP